MNKPVSTIFNYKKSVDIPMNNLQQPKDHRRSNSLDNETNRSLSRDIPSITSKQEFCKSMSGSSINALSFDENEPKSINNSDSTLNEKVLSNEDRIPKRSPIKIKNTTLPLKSNSESRQRQKSEGQFTKERKLKRDGYSPTFLTKEKKNRPKTDRVKKKKESSLDFLSPNENTKVKIPELEETNTMGQFI
jgi:hypothetical protein